MNLHLRRTRPGHFRPAWARRPFAAVLLAGVLVTPLTGCGSGHSAHSGTTAGATPNGQQVAVLYRQLAQCMRQHGAPNLPDPVQNPTTGEWELPPGTAKPPISVLNACKSISDRIPGATSSRAPASAADLALLRQFSQCMRARGVPDYPDPDPSGEFPLPPRLQRLGKQGIMSQILACQRYNPKTSGKSHG